jgi:predicted ATPase/class 3 adenylate cyclase
VTWVGKSLGKYQVVSALGQGAMGVVLKAHDPTIERDVAIKVLAEHLAADATALSRFLAEARAVGKINHPNVMAIYEICQEGPIHYLVLEYVAGGSVDDRLTERNVLSVVEATQVLIDACKGVGAAHAAGLIHRDIKPANFMRTADGAIKVADFGLAKAAANSARGLTQVGMIVGTPLFMSPEQCQAKTLDHRSDIYSLGATYYTLLTGKDPYPEAENVTQVMYLHCHGPILDPRRVNGAVPESCSRIVARAMAKAPAERYQSAAEMLAALQAVAATLTGEMPAGASMAESGAALAPSSRAGPLTPSSSRWGTQAAERRQVTVLVCGCNLFESEAYLEGLDAEDQVKVQHAFQQECAPAVHRFGGVVVQCNEHRLLGCFGYPVAYEDAAGRAANAGLDLLHDMKALGDRLRREHKLALDPWVGLHTGLAIVEAKEDAISLVGEARNVAVRLDDLVTPGQLICSESTHRLLRGQFQSISLGHKKFKGVSQPIEFFHVQGVGVSRSLVEAAGSARLTPLTGRDHETSLLKDRWEQAQEGMGQVVLLVGEAGLGKSRLVHTLKEHVLGQMVEGEADAPVIEWRCSPHYQNTGLRPAIDFFERALGFRPEEPPQDRFDRMLHRVAQYDLARPEIVPLWASLLSLPTPDRFPLLGLPPARQREETFRLILEWLHVRAARGPVLFVVEDLHWVDASTLEFLGQFVAEFPHDRILTLFTFRPEFKPPWTALDHQTSLALTRLTRRQVGDLMRNKAGADLSDALVEKVYDRAGGVPLFVEEFTKMVQEAAMLDEGSTGAQALPAREIPSTLQDLVMARLDRMESGRELAQLAAVLGREFSYELLSAVAIPSVDDVREGRPTVMGDELTLQAELAKLAQAEILYPKGRPPRCTYIFKHALLEDALYNALVKSKRQQFHRRIGEVLEARFLQTAKTQPELLGHHFTEAGLTEKAIGYWLQAGQRSRERSAFCEAIGHLTKGLALLDTLEESRTRDDWALQFLTTLAPAYIAARGYAAPEVGPILVRARELCQRIGEPQQQFGIMLGMWEWRIVRGDLRVCVDLAADGMALAESVNDPGMLMEALFMPGVTMFYRAQFESARACYENALGAHDDRERTKFWTAYSGHDAGVTHRCYLALALWHLGYPDRALRLAGEMCELARTIGHAFSLGHAVDFAAFLYHYCRLGTEVAAMAEEEMTIATEQGFPFWHALGTLHKGAGLLLQGRREESLPILLKGFSAFRATGAEVRVPSYLGLLGDTYTQSARFEDAHKALNEGLTVAEKNDDRCHEAELYRLKGELLLAESSDEGTAAEGWFRQAIETARRQHSRAWELRATMSLARLWQRQARGKEARAALAAVYATYTEGFATPDLVDATTLLEKLA